MTRISIASFRMTLFAVEGSGTPGAQGRAPGVGQQEPDNDWQPI
jgi:hypothetical protein